MEETKQAERVYSGEPTRVTGPDSLRSTTEAKESAGTEKTAAKQTPTVVAPKNSPIVVPGGIGEFVEFLKRTKFIWLMVAGAIFGVMAVVTITTRMSERAREAREKRQEQAVLEVLPDKLIARCGPPAEDITKEMYPMVLRTISYQHGENEKIVFEFSRTAEEKSDWVFLSMKDQSGTRSFESTQEKIAALPCLDALK